MVGRVVFTTDSDTNLEAMQSGISINNASLSWQQQSSRSFIATIYGAVRGRTYTFTFSQDFSLAAGINPAVEWAPLNLPFTLESFAYGAGQSIPVKYANYGAGGQNTSVPLSWSGVPADAKSLALLMYDLHPIAGNWVHWAVVNIPVSASGLPEGASGAGLMPVGSRELVNSFGSYGYGGPQPPPGSGAHEYKCILYALNVDSLNLTGEVSKAQFEASVTGKVLGKTELSGWFSR
jgi:Raf kinase inhibitor-like YbhB/YbcL family protein